jgi:hypothetical protein
MKKVARSRRRFRECVREEYVREEYDRAECVREEYVHEEYDHDGLRTAWKVPFLMSRRAGDTAGENPSFQEGRYAAATSEVTQKRQQEEDMS